MRRTGALAVWRTAPWRRLAASTAALLRQGVTPDRLALSFALGAVLGVFPVLGTTTALCAAVAFTLRLNQVAIQAANYVVYPLQLALLIPLVRVGESLLGAERLPLTPAGLAETLRGGPWHALAMLSTSIGHAVVGWLVVGPAVAAALYLVLRTVLRRAIRRRAT